MNCDWVPIGIITDEVGQADCQVLDMIYGRFRQMYPQQVVKYYLDWVPLNKCQMNGHGKML